MNSSELIKYIVEDKNYIIEAAIQGKSAEFHTQIVHRGPPNLRNSLSIA